MLSEGLLWEDFIFGVADEESEGYSSQSNNGDNKKCVQRDLQLNCRGTFDNGTHNEHAGNRKIIEKSSK